MRWTRTRDVALITSAPRSPGHEFEQRRRRYALLMSLRVVCLLGAVCTYTVSIWIALALVIGGAALPWCAVLIANDGPPRSKRAPNRMNPAQSRELPPPPPPRTIDYE